MKFGRKGFMMAEVVVVSVVIAVVLITLFTGLNRVSSAYEKRDRYYDIDALYLAMMANDALIENGSINNLINDGTSTNIEANDVTNSNINNINNIYKNIVNDNSVNLYFSLYEKGKIDKLKDLSTTKETTKEFIDYLGTKFDFNDDYNYVIISEICKNDDDCYYYALKVR